MTQLYNASAVIEYMQANHNVTMYKQTIWEICRRHGIQPKPAGKNRRLGITEDELKRLAESYRPRTWEGSSVPQRAPKTVHSNGFTISEDTSSHRPRLAPQLERVMVTARQGVIAHRQQVAERRARTGESAYEASLAIRQDW